MYCFFLRNFDTFYIQYNMRSSTATTVILDENDTQTCDTTGRQPDQRPSYFQFFLVKEKKQVFICTTCSSCMSSEEKMKVGHISNDD